MPYDPGGLDEDGCDARECGAAEADGIRSPEEVAACTLGTPTVLVLFADGTYRAVMGPDDLELDGSVPAFFDALDRVVSRSLPSDEGLGAPDVTGT